MTPLRTPWIGNEYQSQKHKILFVGLSFYSKEHFEAHKVNENSIVQFAMEYARGDWENRTMKSLITHFGRIFGITFSDAHSKQNFFDKISYTNYIQHCMSDPSEKPAKYYIYNEDYRQHFYNIIEELKPDYVILNTRTLHYWWVGCGIVQFLKDKNIDYHHTKHLSRITNKDKIHIQTIVDEIIKK